MARVLLRLYVSSDWECWQNFNHQELCWYSSKNNQTWWLLLEFIGYKNPVAVTATAFLIPCLIKFPLFVFLSIDCDVAVNLCRPSYAVVRNSRWWLRASHCVKIFRISSFIYNWDSKARKGLHDTIDILKYAKNLKYMQRYIDFSKRAYFKFSILKIDRLSKYTRVWLLFYELETCSNISAFLWKQGNVGVYDIMITYCGAPQGQSLVQSR